MGAAITLAMRSFAGWLTARPWRLPLVTVVSMYLLAPVAGACIVLDGLKRSPAAAMTTTLIALVAITIGGLAAGSSVAQSLGLSATILFGAMLGVALLYRTRSLSLVFQCLILGGILATLVLFVFVPELARIGEFMRAQILEVLESLSVTEAARERYAATPATLFVRWLLPTVLFCWIVAVLLGYWWYGLITETVRFGRDFRALRLGRVVGGIGMALVLAQALFPAEVIVNMAQFAVIGFLFQGLAVVHARSRSDNWHWAILVLVYVSFVSPLVVITVAGLSVVGLLDNFFALRARVEPRN